MNNVLKTIIFSMLGLLLANNQLVYSQATDLNYPMSRSTKLIDPMSQATQMSTDRELLMEIKEFFMGLSGVKVDCTGGSARQPQGKMIASFNHPMKKGMMVGSGAKCNVFYMASRIQPVGPERTSNVVVLDKSRMSAKEKSVLMTIHNFFMTLENEGKVMIVSQAGTNMPNEEPIAQYMNPEKGAMLGGARGQVFIYATPFHTTGLLGTEGKGMR